MFRKVLLLIFLASSVIPVIAQENMQFGISSQELSIISQEANSALGTFVKLVREQNYERMGFDNPEDIKKASLGIPLREYFVSLESLKSYKADSNPGDLLEDSGQVIFPLLVDERVKSSVTLVQQEGKWITHSFGAPVFVGLISKTRSDLSNQMDKQIQDFFLVKAPALNVFFVGYYLQGEVMLAPLQDEPRFNFEAGQTIRADDAFREMQIAAEKHNGLPT